MHAVAADRPDNPLDPVRLPEFAATISWCMCRNPACANFGIPYTGPSPPRGQPGATDEHGRLDLSKGRFRCKACDMSFELKSNLAVRAIARHFLDLSLPYADCSNPQCVNHGRNVFECYTSAGTGPPPGPAEQRLTGKRRRPYRKMGEHRVYCRECGTDGRRKAPHAFMLGTSLSAKGRLAAQKHVLEMLRGIDEQRSITGTINRMQMGVGSYYTRLHRISHRLRDYSAWRNASMLRPDFWPRDGVARVYVDDFIVSLQRLGDGPRFQSLAITVSVLGLDDTYYVLAAHPHFLPKDLCPEPDELVAERRLRLPSWACRWDSLWHEFQRGTYSGDTPPPYVGLGGRFIHEHYAHLAHFLVIRKMLARCPHVHLYMDGSKPLVASALTAFAADIRGGKAEIVSFQHKGKRQNQQDVGGAGPTPRSDAGMARAWKAWESRVKKRIQAPDELDLSQGQPPDPKVLARAWKRSMTGAFSEPGSWAWLEWPPGRKRC